MQHARFLAPAGRTQCSDHCSGSHIPPIVSHAHRPWPMHAREQVAEQTRPQSIWRPSKSTHPNHLYDIKRGVINMNGRKKKHSSIICVINMSGRKKKHSSIISVINMNGRRRNIHYFRHKYERTEEETFIHYLVHKYERTEKKHSSIISVINMNGRKKKHSSINCVINMNGRKKKHSSIICIINMNGRKIFSNVHFFFALVITELMVLTALTRFDSARLGSFRLASLRPVDRFAYSTT